MSACGCGRPEAVKRTCPPFAEARTCTRPLAPGAKERRRISAPFSTDPLAADDSSDPFELPRAFELPALAYRLPHIDASSAHARQRAITDLVNVEAPIRVFFESSESG